MQLGLVGLGRMGANMARRLTANGHTVVGYDVASGVVERLGTEGAIEGASDLADLCGRLAPPRVVWVMVPAAFVPAVMDDLGSFLEADDIVIDGGNSYYQDDVDRAERMAAEGIHHVDVGVSGGIWGLEQGYCLMVGGEAAPVERLTPIFRSLAPGVEAAPRTSPDQEVGTEEEGWFHCGPAGAGHFVKMVHNGVEYGMMAALAEGLAILERADVGLHPRPADAETAPLPHPRYYQFEFDIPRIAELWRRGSVVRSWLLDLTAAALATDPDLSGFAGQVSDSGEGRWTVQAAVDEGVPADVIAAALFARFSSRDNGVFAHKLVSAMREQFGGHAERAV